MHAIIFYLLDLLLGFSDVSCCLPLFELFQYIISLFTLKYLLPVYHYKKKLYLHYFVLCTWVLHFIHLIKIKFKQPKIRRGRGILPAAVHNWMIDRTSLVLPRSCSKHLLWGLSSWPAATACTESPPIFNSRRWIHGRRAEDVCKSCWSWHNCFKVILRRDKG